MDILKNLNEVSLGFAILNTKIGSVIFENESIRGFEKKDHDTIFSHIFEYVKESCTDVFREVKLSNGSIVGYSVYPAEKDHCVVLLNMISYKKLFTENRRNNDYFSQLSSLTAEIAHEVGNPLSSVIMTLQVLLNGFPGWDDELKKEYIEISIKELNRLSKFMKRVRKMSLENKLDLRKQPLKPLIEQVISGNRVLFDKKDIQVENKVPASSSVMIDQPSFHQVMFNLIHNSAAILPKAGKIYIDIEGDDTVSDYYTKLVFRNNGPVLDKEEKRKIFTPFYSNRANGNGLGMSVALKLMTRMGGTINVTKPPKGWGAQFNLYIPVRDIRKQMSPAVGMAWPGSATGLRWKKTEAGGLNE